MLLKFLRGNRRATATLVLLSMAGISTARWAHAAGERGRSLPREEIVAYYSVDDKVCQPLAKALTVVMNEKLSSANFMRHPGNDKILARAGFTPAKPLPDIDLSGVDLPGQYQVYDLDLANNGRERRIYFYDTNFFGWQWATNWFVLKQGHVLDSTTLKTAARPGRLAPLPKDDIAAENFDPENKAIPDGLLLPFDPKYRVKKWRFNHPDPQQSAESFEMDLAKLSLLSFTLPFLYQSSTVYLLSSAITDGGGDDEFMLSRFTPELKLEATCYLVSTDDLSSSTTNPTAP